MTHPFFSIESESVRKVILQVLVGQLHIFYRKHIIFLAVVEKERNLLLDSQDFRSLVFRFEIERLQTTHSNQSSERLITHILQESCQGDHAALREATDENPRWVFIFELISLLFY